MDAWIDGWMEGKKCHSIGWNVKDGPEPPGISYDENLRITDTMGLDSHHL